MFLYAKNRYINKAAFFLQRKTSETSAMQRSHRSTYYSLTPPSATPAMMNLLSAKYTMISGSAVSVRPR